MISCANAGLAEARIRASVEIPAPTIPRAGCRLAVASEISFSGIRIEAIFVGILVIGEPFMEVSHRPSAAGPSMRRLREVPMVTAPGEWDRPRDEWLSAATDAMRRGVRGADSSEERRVGEEGVSMCKS